MFARHEVHKRSSRQANRLPLLAVAFLSSACLSIGPADAQPAGSVTWPLALNDTIWTDTNIPVCWLTTPGGYDEEKQWVRDAVLGSWSAVSAVNFLGWGNCTADSQGIRIQIDDSQPLTQGLGTDLIDPANVMVLNFDFMNWGETCAASREFCIRAIAAHEFGHALGFTHEHNRVDTYDCDEDAQGPNPTVVITEYDPESIMNYCSTAWNNNGLLTATDVAGVRSVYGPFTSEMPAAFSYAINMTIVDSETILADETGTQEFRGSIALTGDLPSVTETFSHCVGNEVRVDLDFFASIDPASTLILVEPVARMYEGSSCHTRELEDSGREGIELGTLPTSGTIALRNPGVSADTADITIDVTRTTGGTRVVDAASCALCASMSQTARFAQRPGGSDIENLRRAVLGLGGDIQWAVTAGSALDAADGWVIGTNATRGGFGIYRWNGAGWEPMPGGALRIGGPFDRPWVVNSDNRIYRWNGADWDPMPGSAHDVADGWVIGTNATRGGFGIYRWNGTGWDSMPGGAVRIGGRFDRPWVVNSDNRIYRWNGADWDPMPGSAQDVADGWVVGTNATRGGYGIYRWSGGNWEQVPGGGVHVGGAHNAPWLVNDANRIYRIE